MNRFVNGVYRETQATLKARGHPHPPHRPRPATYRHPDRHPDPPGAALEPDHPTTRPTRARPEPRRIWTGTRPEPDQPNQSHTRAAILMP